MEKYIVITYIPYENAIMDVYDTEEEARNDIKLYGKEYYKELIKGVFLDV